MILKRTLLSLLLCAVPLPAFADDSNSYTCAGAAGRMTIVEEDDYFSSHDDRHFTHGLRFSCLRPQLQSDSGWKGTFDWLGRNTPIMKPEKGATRHLDIILGQNMYTPENIKRINPDPLDRPYAGWLYTGLGLMQDNNSKSLDHVELLVGVVGPLSLAGPTQNNFHKGVLHQDTAHGWDHQLRNEPGVMLSFERIWRINPLGVSWLELLPEAGLTAGNVMTYAHTGAQLRIGKGLKADYGQPHIRPSTSGTDYFNADKLEPDSGCIFNALGCYVFIAAQGRLVPHNIFLDGNSWVTSANIDSRATVADVTAGFSMFWSSNVKMDYYAGVRTREFDGQKRLDRLGGLNLSFTFR